MIITIAQWVLIAFGIFFMCVGLLMLVAPKKARQLVRKAASTNVINYAEITIRMIPAVALIVYADHSKYPEVFNVFGWLMIATSAVLYVVPRHIHHRYSSWCADKLQPLYFQLISPFAFLFGITLLYSIF